MGGSKNVFIKSAVILVVLGVLAVNGHENDDLVFDQDGKNPGIEVPLIQRQKHSSFFQRIKRGVWDWFSAPTTSTESPKTENETTTATVEKEPVATPNRTKTKDILDLFGDDSKDRKPRASDEENIIEHENSSPKNDNDNDIGEFAAGHTDDEDLAGSGEVEGSAVDGDGWVTESPRVGGQARFYRITLTVLEPFREEYRDRNSEEHKELAGSLVKGIEDLYRQKIPDYEHFANVVKIARLEDAFTSEVTLDIGSTFGDEAEVRNILERQLLFHTLGGIPVDSKGFTFRNFQGPGVEGECDENTELRCRDGSCAPLNSRCDNEYDCADGSDEFDCPQYTLVGENHPEESEEVTPRPVDSPTVGNNSGRTECRGDDYAVACTDGSRHICTLQKCDGVQDCDDGADEEGCSSSGCASGEFVCDVTRCILDSQRCDFSVDCEDGSDEQSCTYPICTQSEFKCRNSQCLEASLRCNGINDCRDGSDEINCPCKDDQFECTPLYCISAELRCDGIHHCSNGQDEKDCEQTNPRCRQDEFECDNGNCINSRLRCDGRSDCSDRSDERNCTVTTCTSDEFRCQDGTCLGIEKRCNGHHDCRNGEDETQCGCGTSEFICEDGQCIPYKLQCNGVNDCRDGSDERDCENVIRQDFDNINPLDRRIGIITTEGTKKKERFYNPDRSARIKEDPAKISSISTGFEIPSAGDFGDPNIAAYPEFGLMVEKLFNTHETNDASTLNKDWEYIEFKDPGNRQKLTKSKTVARNAERDIEATLFNGIVTIGTDYYEGLDYDEDTTSSATEKTEMRTISGLYKNDLVDGASAAASSPKFLLSDRATVTAESSDSSGLIDETFDSGKLKNLRKTERNTKSDRVYDANATFLHSNFNSSKNVSDGIIKPSTKSPISLNTDDSKEETNSSQRVSQSIDVHETGQSNGNSSNELSDNTRRVTVGFSNATTERALIRYFKKYNVTRRIPESTEPPLGSHNRSASLKLSMNSSTPTSEMEDGGKLNRSSKVLGIPQSMDIFDENLPSKNFLEQENASTVATTRGPSFETSRNPARAKKLKNFYFYMDKYNVTKSRKLGTPDDIETPAATKASSVEHIGAANNGTDQLGKKKESLKLKDTKDPKHRENRGKTRVSKDGRRRKNNKKKSDPYKNVKVETELFEKNHVELPKRLRLNVTEKIRGEDKKAAPVIISRGNDNDDTDDCSRVCFKCLLKFNAKKATTPKSSILTEPIFDVKSIENVDSGLTETSDNEMITNSNVQTNSIDSNEAEWIEISTTTKKTRQRKKSRKATRTRFPTTTEAMKIHGQESTTNELPTKSTATPKNSAASRRKRVRNGKRNRRRKTSKKVTTNTPLEGQSTMGISEPSPGLSTLISIDLSDFPSTNNVRTTEPRISTDSSTPLSTDDPEAHNATSRTNKFEIIASASQPPAPETTCGPVDLVCQVQKFVRDSIMEVATSTSQSPSTEATPGTRDAKTHSESTSAVPESVQPSSTQRSKDCDDFFGDCWDRGSSETQSSQTVSEEPERAAPLVATPAKNCDSFACWLEKLPGFRESFNLRGTSTEPSRSVSSAERAEDHELESNESSAWERLEKFPSPETAKAKPDKLSTSLNENFSTEMDVSEEIVPTDARPSKLLSTVAEKSTQSSRFPWDPWFSEVTSDGDSKIGEKKTFTKLYDSTASGPPARALQKSTIYPCPDDQYRCDRDRCIELDRVCNGIIDCYDRTDETICPSGQNRPDYIGHGSRDRCRIDQHPCDETKCLEIENTCDGIPHCEDGSDETDCEDYINRRNEVLNDYRNRYRLRKTAMTSVGPHENPRRPTRRRPCLEEFEYRCNNGECIAEVRQCDGVIDCVDGDDEDPVLCGDRECTPTQFKCGSGGKCIEGVYRCDGHPDCPDKSDEDCPGSSTENVTHIVTHNNTEITRNQIGERPWTGQRECDLRSEFRCDDGSCIQLRRKCDNVFDCLDNSDEKDCGLCAIDQWKCTSGECIPENERCDGEIHCPDRSDEIECVTECPAGTFRCGDGLCLDSKRRCDGRPNCRDGSDEINCQSPYCPDGQLPCANGVCISRRFFCDRNTDCLDGSDEKNCPDIIPDPYPPPCQSDQFTCNDGSCIPVTSRCNGRADCPNDEDEHECRRGCARDQFQCRNGDCINTHQKCDGFVNCDDGSDEEGCEADTTPANRYCTSQQFTCVSDRTCVHYSSRCNGIPDCRDRSDEEGCETDLETEGLLLKTYPSEQIIKESREVVFQCRDEGQLRAHVRWLRGNGLPLPPGSRDLNGRLEIPNVQLDHSGLYICEAVGYSSSTPGQQVSVHLEVEKFDPPSTRPPQVCKYDEATCSNGMCILKSFVCDGKFDCADGSDEMRCSPHGCEPNQFRCANKQCVSKIWRCDGDKDCADGSDEENCAPPPPGSPCRYDEYACSSYDQCIPKSYHCDMERDCQDGSDEIGCSPVYITKPPPAMVNLQPGESLILTCTAIGVPIPEINWRLNWGHVPSKCSSTSVNGTGTLNCPDMQVSDQGAYSCEALNVGGFVFAVPDAIVVMDEKPDICPPGKFNSEARTPEECISCFCFGVADKCKSANLFTYQLPPPFDRYKVVTVETGPELRINGEINYQVAEVKPRGSSGAEISAPYNTELTSYNVPYFELPDSYYGPSQLKSYGGYLKYKISYSGDGSPNYAPDVIISGNGYTLLHRGQPVQPDITTERSVRFFYGEWLKNERGQEIPASREEIMMVLLKVEHILIKAKYEDSPELQVTITDITMDTADKGNNGLVASYVEECTCPTGYSGESCQNCANGYLRRKSGSWLGECYRDVPPCPPGYYGDPLRNIPCTACPCPLTNPANQFGRTCRLGADRNPICDCPPGYIGHRCEQCAAGYHGNPLIPGDMCVPDELCDPHGSINPTADADGKCHCKLFVTGLKCDQCKANTFNLASKNQFGCISCFCMGNTDKCTSSNWYRNEIRVSFTNSIRDFTLVESNAPNAQRIVQGIRLDTISREIVYSAFPNRGNTDVYYWQLPAIFLGNQIASYGGDLRYTLRYIPSPGGQSSRNNAADVELISENHINLLYFSRETHEANLAQSFTVPLLEQYWQRADGTQADREHLLMALADVREIRIKATYTTHTEEAALSFVSLETAEKQNNGNERAVEVEECNCPIGYRGLSCEDCAVGYTRVARGIYLGFCEPCSCNGNSNQCDPETGICEYCGNHTTGDNCELCEPGYEGDPTRGGCTRKDNNPGHCQCNSAGSRSERCIDGRCECKANVEGAECNRCRPSTFGLAAENLNGCNECYCSGVTNQCHESSLYIQQIPMVVYDSRHGFTLTDPTRKDVIDDEFELNLASNEIGYRYSHNRNRRLFWSLPPAFTGNKVKSYGGSLTLTQHITALPNSQILKDQDVLLEGNGIRLFWTNPQEIVPGIPLTYTVVLRESEWRRLSTEGPRRASRNDLMTVLSNLEAILVRASHSEGMTATYISDISLDTAVEIVSGRRATQIEACRCPPGYSGTSCETCARGYYRDINDRSVSILGSCVLCPCNDHEESCELSRSDQVKCHCLLGYTGQYCQDIVDYPPTPRPVPTPTIIPPRIIVSIQEKKFQIVHTGSTVRYHCNGRSVDNSPLNIRWIKEGSPLPELSVDDARGLLVLRNVRVSDSGVYVCQVSDGVSLAVEKVTLTVGGSNPVAPRVVIHPQYNRVVEGGSLQFTCEATGNPQPEVEWVRVKGRMNPQSTFQNGVWQLSTVTMEDAGEYKCIARNEVGDREHSAMVYVLDAPRPNPDFDLRPTITPTYWIGNAGDPVKLICTKTPNHVRVSWARFGSLPLPISASERNGVLSIANPIENDSGRYICIATSLQGIEYSSYVNVTIHSRTQPNVRVDPDRQTVSQGTSAEVRCIADRDSGLQIKWIKYGETSLGPNARQIGDSLVLTKPQVADRGVYICRASNAAGSYEASTIIEVEPREVPILEIYPKTSQVVNLGGSSDLQCRVAAGFPIPEVHWSRDDGRHFGSNIEQLPGGVLRLINITLADGGAYKCSASNIVGSTSAIARIEVQAMPTITILPAGGLIYAKPNSRVRLTCTAQGIPPPNVAWLKSTPGVSVYNFAARGSDSSHLSAVHEIMSMSSKDEGSYTCQAVNAAGITEKRVQIRLEEDNSVPEPCRGDVPCDDEDGHSGSVGDNKPGVRIPEDYLRIPNGGRVEFRCNVFVPDGSQIYLDWKRSDRRPLPEGSTVHSGVLTIPKVTKDAVGEYVCSGLNHLGVELFRAKAHLDVVSLPSIQLNPNRQTVGPGESPAIVCTATGDQPMTLEWEAIGRPLPSSVTHDRGVLQFHGIHYTDAGKYVCKATNNAGTADAVAEVLVSENTIEDSDIRAVERDITTSAGNSVRLRCLVQQRSTIHWTKDGHPLSRNIRVGDDYIELVAVQPEDSGKYVCQTRNPHGVSSDYINLRVDGSISPVVSIEPSLDIVNIGDMIDLRCTYTGTQNPRYRWSRPNHPSLPVNALEHGNVLRISNIELTETGVYRCHADTAEGTYEQDFNLIVQGGTNDAPAIETKYVPYGSSLEIGCRKDLEHPLKFQWSKLGGMLPPDAQMFGDKLKLVDVKSEDAGTYICTATNGVENSEVPTVLVVTGVVPNFNQAPQSWISLPPLPDSYLKFNIEVSFKPERDDGIILYNDEKADGTGDFISLSLVRGYPEFKFDLGSGVSVIRADQPLSLSEWHTIKLQRTRKEGTMIVDGEGIYKAVNPGRKQGLDLKEPLYIGGVPDYSSINSKVEMNAGFVGCISKLVLGEKNVDLIGDQSDSVGVTTCETCAENPCNNAGVCQEASTKNGYKCLCRAGYSGKHCDSTGESCYPGACGDGSCVDTESGFECYCGHGRSGPRCEYMTVHMKEPSIRNNRAYMSYPTPSAARRLIPRNAIKAKRSHARSSHTPQLRKGRSRSARLKHHNVHSTKH